MTPNDIYQGLIKEGVPAKDAQILVATAKSESGLNPNAAGDSGNSIGLFQIYIKAHYDKLMAWTGSARAADWIIWLKDPQNNIKAAAAVYKSQGLGAWTEYNNGHYKQYLNIVDPGSSTTKLPGDTISSYTPTAAENLKNNIMDLWYSMRGTSRKVENIPSYEEILKAKTNYNKKYGTDLDTSTEQAAIDYKNNSVNSIIEYIILGVIIIFVVIVGTVSFFKTFDIEAPGIPG